MTHDTESERGLPEFSYFLETSTYEMQKDAIRAYARTAIEKDRAERSEAVPGGIGVYGDADHAEWLADKIVALGDYAKEAAQMLRRWPSAPPERSDVQGAETTSDGRDL